MMMTRRTPSLDRLTLLSQSTKTNKQLPCTSTRGDGCVCVFMCVCACVCVCVCVYGAHGTRRQRQQRQQRYLLLLPAALSRRPTVPLWEWVRPRGQSVAAVQLGSWRPVGGGVYVLLFIITCHITHMINHDASMIISSPTDEARF
eukprot:GHVU01206918.1.p1 GENE.GHVU01206918.1~~GHVU01206918.1.p1  ORF type:complete len:145 (-),score=9.27 GHVU01206918.1:8-442(-)